MDALADLLAFLAGLPALAGLLLAAITIFLTSDWRLALTGLLVQYLLLGAALTRFIQPEVALAKILAGVLAVSILYLTARHIQELKGQPEIERMGRRILGLRIGWGAGPLGLPLRLLVVLLVALAVMRLFDLYHSPLVPADIVFAALWLGGMGVAGLVLGEEPLRVAPAVLTFLTGFDLVYTGLEPSLAVTGFLGALILLAALAFSYLATVHSLGARPLDEEEAES